MIWSVMQLGYGHELDLLEIKLATQDPIVDRFVICEAPWSYSGAPKALWFDGHAKRWDPWRDKLVHVVVEDDPPSTFEPFQGFGVREQWQRENWQRMRASAGLIKQGLEPDDVVIVSDLDEILTPYAVEVYLESEELSVVHPQIPMHRHFLNLHWRDRMALSIARICRGRDVMNDPLGVEGVRRMVNIREWPVPFWAAYSSAAFDLSTFGWHFSWMGGTAAIDAKLRLAAHPEERNVWNSTRTAIRELVAKGGDLQGEHRRLFWIPDERLPAHAQLERFAHLRCGPQFATIDPVPGMYWNG